jgi:glycosyltransferase-like protein LARGE
MAVYVDVHLVLDTFDRQFNTWRNVARLFARTEYVMMLDVDFYICTDFRETLRNLLRIGGKGELGEREEIRQMFDTGVAALVVPAFEYVNYEEGREYKTFPKTKKVCRTRLFLQF